MRRVDQHFRNETPFYQAEFRVLRKDGTFAWLESRGIVVERSLDGQPLRMIGFHLDISDRKANEQLRRDLEVALRRNQEELEALVRLQTRKLIETADAAEQGNRAKNVLLANVGQELRGPSRASCIDSCARLLDGGLGELPSQVREHLELIRQSARQLSESVERLARRQPHRDEHTRDLRHVREPAPRPAGAVRIDAGSGAGAGTRPEGRHPALKTSSCSQTEPGSPRSCANCSPTPSSSRTTATCRSAREFSTARCWSRFRTRASAFRRSGMATVFHAFQPIADQQPVLREGLGLGLSISRAVVDAMGGSIGVTSKPGHGSRFWFTLPLAASAQRVSSTRH